MLTLLRNLVAAPDVEHRAALLNGQHVTYTLKRSRRRRSIGLHIDSRGLIVSVPVRASERWLQSVLQEHAHWVVKKLGHWKQAKEKTLRWEDGEEMNYLGEPLTLRVEKNLFATPTLRRAKALWVYAAYGSEAAHIEYAVTCWYRQQADIVFAERVAHYAPLLNVMPRVIKLSTAKTQWGSCTEHGSVHLNVQLIKLPVRLLDYVVVHELSHLREMNHSAAFWRVVESVCADYAVLRKELKAIDIR